MLVPSQPPVQEGLNKGRIGKGKECIYTFIRGNGQLGVVLFARCETPLKYNVSIVTPY